MKLTLLQKEILLWLAFFLLCTAGGIYYINHTPNEHPGIIRLHVVANSDSPEDQALKLKVRNEIIRFMEESHPQEGQADIETARAYITDNIDRIEEISNRVIRESGFDYPAGAALTVTYIPQKSYEDLTLPAGNYEALKVTLGRGDGQNWWCVIFPQLCLIGEKDGSEKIVLKSKIKELMKDDLTTEVKGVHRQKER